MKKVLIFLPLLLLFASCETITQVDEYLGDRLRWDNFEDPQRKPDAPPAAAAKPETTGTTDVPKPETTTETGKAETENALVNLPEEPPVSIPETETKLPDAELDLPETDYPEQAPDEEPSVPPNLDTPVIETTPPDSPVPPANGSAAQQQRPTPPQTPPAQQAQVQPPVPQTPQPVQQAPAQPQTPPVAVVPPPRRETPPPTPPAAARPSQPVPPPAPVRENPSPPLPDMPFQPAAAGAAAASATASAETSKDTAAAEKNLEYSRTVRALVGQYIEIPFRGPGWVYLGEYGSRRGVSYDSRRLEEEGMTFIFRAGEAGTYSLRFNRQDFVRDYILNDYVKVIVEDPPAVTGSAWFNPQQGPDRVYASPRWPTALYPDGIPAVQRPQSGTEPPSAGVPAVAGTPVAAPPAAPSSGTPAVASAAQPVIPAQSSGVTDGIPAAEDWLKKAREEYDGGRIPGALSALDNFMIQFPAGSDEAYWLYGQSLEANNENTRNITLALDYYRRLVREYPQSSRYDETRRRISYLERFYFTIQ
ncbi:hypothetical protein AGMMS50230_00810 [Spirochaetia bacterium]|nr:hypothetical protein AGMMS50230_00810 [Spirochaetia bacterium]